MRFFELYHDRSRQMPPIGPREEWPESWKSVTYKEYPAMSKLALPDLPEETAIEKNIHRRQSLRSFSKEPLPLSLLARLLQRGLGFRETGNADSAIEFRRRRFPSAGARYPLETYILALKTKDFESGLYHFSPLQNALERLGNGTILKESLQSSVGYPWATDAAGIIFFSAVFGRSIEKYGERGYRLILLEAGHAGQNICLIAESLGVKSCVVALRDEAIVNDGLSIDGVSESIVHTIALGL